MAVGTMGGHGGQAWALAPLKRLQRVRGGGEGKGAKAGEESSCRDFSRCSGTKLCLFLPPVVLFVHALVRGDENQEGTCCVGFPLSLKEDLRLRSTIRLYFTDGSI